MIKIEITDPHLLDMKTLHATGTYLLNLAGEESGPGDLCNWTDQEVLDGLKRCQADLEESMKPTTHWDISDGGEDKTTVDARKHYVAPALTPLANSMATKDSERGRGFHPVVPHDDLGIEEELIPVPPEVVSVVPPLPAHEVFKPAVELDIEGLPWDLRIHARTKTKNKDGSWKKLRGAGPEVVKRIEAELRGVQSIPVPPLVLVAPPLPGEAPATVPGFSDLMSLVTKSITEGRLRRDQVVEILKPFGIPSLPLVSTRLDLIPSIMASITEVANAPC